MADANSQLETATPGWTPDKVRAWFAAKGGTSIADRKAATSYHQAAAVLASFDHVLLRVGMAGPPVGEDLRRLLADCVPVSPTTVDRSTKPSDRITRWSLKPDPRRETLASFPDATSLRNALSWNPRPARDRLQDALTGYITGTALAPEAQDDEQLGWSAQVIGWLAATPFARELNLPNPDDVRGRLDFVRLLSPLRRMVGDHFRGRRSELKALHDFLLQSATGDLAPKPAGLHGFGGSGKTTLLAKVLLDYCEGRLDGVPGPIVFLDFDRPSLVPQEPATLLREAVRQLACQMSGKERSAADALIQSLDSALQSSLAARDDSGSAGQILTGNFAAVLLNEFASLFQSGGWQGRFLLVILDTFEEVQYHSQKVVESVWSFLGQLRARLPQVRVIVAGRAQVRIENQTHPFALELPLDELDADAAVACLNHYEIPDDLARFIHSHVGGNPLALRLAAELVRMETARGFRDFISSEFGHRLQDELVQAILWRRFLGHVKSAEVRKLAHPGLTLRRITPELIKEVLAGPCGIEVPDMDKARELWHELARETALVVQESGAMLRHRPELRRQMIGLLRVKNSKQVQDIHVAAVGYFQRFEDTASRAEEFYHRLCLGQPREELDARWSQDLEDFLRSAREELPESALLYLASRSTIGFESLSTSTEDWNRQELIVWERKTAQWARELIRQDRYEEVDKELRRRADRTGGSPLFQIHARVLMSLGQPAEAASILINALSGWPTDAIESERIDLLLLCARSLLRTGDRSTARERWRDADARAQWNGSSEQRLEAARLAVRVAIDPRESNAALARLANIVTGWSPSQFRQIPVVARKVAAELIGSDNKAAAIIIQSVGLGRVDTLQQDRLAQALYAVDAGIVGATFRLSFVAGFFRPDADPSRPGGEPPTPASWRTWLETSPSEGVAQFVSRVLAESLLTVPLVDLLQEILRGPDDVAERRAADVRTSERKLSHGELVRRIHDAILYAFRDRVELEQFVRFSLSEKLPNIAAIDSPLSHIAFELIIWAEGRGRMRELIDALARERPHNPKIAELLRMLENKPL